MKSCLPALPVCLLVLATFAPAQLEDFGPNGEYFRDTSTGLYWVDPDTFTGQSRAMIDAWVIANPAWRWATTTEVQALVGKSSTNGADLETIMGRRQFTLTGGRSRWVGYCGTGVGPLDGWLVQAFSSVNTLDAGGQQLGVATWNPGGWVVTTAPPPVGPTLTITQPGGSGSIQVDINGPANTPYFTAVSFDQMNVVAPNQGWWFGLHIGLIDIVNEFNTGVAPFIGTTDATGAAIFTLPAGSLSPGLTLHCLTTFWTSGYTAIDGSTGVETITLN